MVAFFLRTSIYEVAGYYPLSARRRRVKLLRHSTNYYHIVPESVGYNAAIYSSVPLAFSRHPLLGRLPGFGLRPADVQMNFPDGDYGIYKYDEETCTSLADGTSNNINTGTIMNRLKVKREGDLIEAYANEELLASISDGSYTGMRYVGLIVNSYDDPNVDVMFDNFAVYPITCNQAADQSSEARTPSTSLG